MHIPSSTTPALYRDYAHYSKICKIPNLQGRGCMRMHEAGSPGNKELSPEIIQSIHPPFREERDFVNQVKWYNWSQIIQLPALMPSPHWMSESTAYIQPHAHASQS